MSESKDALEEPKRPKLPFVAVVASGQRYAVVRGSEHIAWVKSHTMAKRIANALNQYEPNSRGE